MNYEITWNEMFNLLKIYKECKGHCNVPRSYMEYGKNLGNWLHKQREKKKKGDLNGLREKRLEEVGVAWDVLSEKWEKNYRLLLKFRQREGHSNVPARHIEDGTKLGNWLDRQRREKKKGKLDRSLDKRLEDAGIAWDMFSEQWENNYCLLVEYRQREGHSNVPYKHIEDGRMLGNWLDGQRKQKKKRKLDRSLLDKLEDTGVVWDVLTEQWEINYRLLVKFQQREGHSNVPARHIEDGTKLGNWLDTQRQQKKKEKLSFRLVKRLEDAGVVWDVLTKQWEKNYHMLLKFRQREGHSNVPRSHIEHSVKLGNWLNTQRQKKKKERLELSCENKLNEMDVVWAFSS